LFPIVFPWRADDTSHHDRHTQQRGSDGTILGLMSLRAEFFCEAISTTILREITASPCPRDDARPASEPQASIACPVPKAARGRQPSLLAAI
jgi:hypothetical protein